MNNANNANDGNDGNDVDGVLSIINLWVFNRFNIIIELTVQKNSISGVWDWNFGQIMSMVLTLIEVISSIFRTFKRGKWEE